MKMMTTYRSYPLTCRSKPSHQMSPHTNRTRTRTLSARGVKRACEP